MRVSIFRSSFSFTFVFAIMLAVASVILAIEPAEMPVSDCGSNYVLKLRYAPGQECDLGIVSGERVSEQVRHKLNNLNEVDPLPESVNGIRVSSRIGAFDEVMSWFVKIFMHR